MARQKVAIEIEVIRGGNTQATVKAISDLELELAKLNKQLREAKKQGDTGTYTKLRGETAVVKANLKDLNHELTTQQKDFKALAFAPGSYHAISAEVSKLKREFQGLSREAREGIAGAQLRTRINGLTNDLKKADASVGVFTRNVGNYASAFKGLVPLLGAVGVGFGIGELVQQTQLAVKTFADFQQEIKTLQAISGATGDEMAALERNARTLGQTTQFTALEVAKLQTNFARIGLTAPEIIAATESTVNLAIATTENVERASEVMGAAINGFSLGADQAGRIGDVMTEAFNRTALSLDKWAEAQKFAATTATAAGVSIEGTAAAMGILADSGLEGSNIGTILRRIFSDLSTEGSKLSKEIGFTVRNTDDFTRALKILSSAGVDNSKAFQLVGRYAQSGLLALVDRADDIGDLTTALEGANGAAARTAAIVGDTLSQDVLKAKSAIEGLRINLVTTSNEGLRGMVQGFTSLVDLLNKFVALPVSEQMEAERVELNALVTALTLSNDNQETRSRLISEISAKYPAFLKQVNIETASTEELQVALGEVNKEYTTRILLQKLAEEVEKRQEKVARRQEQLAQKTKDAGEALSEAITLLGGQTLTYEQALTKLEARAKTLYDAELRRTVNLNREAELASILRTAAGGLENAKFNEAKATDQLTKAEDKRAKTLDTIRQQFPAFAAAMDLMNQQEAEQQKHLEASGESAGDLRARLADLKAELADLPEGSPLFEQITDEIGQIEGKLGALSSAGPKAEKIIAGSLKALQAELTALNAELENTPSSGAKFVHIAQRIQAAQAAITEEMKRRDLVTFDVKDFLGDPADIEANVRALEDSLKFDESVKQLRIEASVVDTDKAEDSIQRLELQRIASLRRQLREGVITEEQYNREKERIAAQTELAILDSRLASFEVGSTEYLRLVQEIADKEIAINQKKNEQIDDDQRTIKEAAFNAAFSAANDIANALVRVEENRIQQELDASLMALDEEYTRKIELAEGNTALQEQLQAELDAKKAAAEKEAAERRKALAKKEAIINTALAAIKTVAELGFTPLGFIALAAQAVALATQLATIESTTFGRGGRIRDVETKARGGKVSGKSHAQGGEKFTVHKTGQRVELEGGEGVVNKRSMASRDVLSVTGTPAEIISGVNAYRGWGDAFTNPPWVRVVKRTPTFQTGGVVPETPQFVNPNQFMASEMSVNVAFTDAQIEILADRIAAKTAKQTGEAVQAGMGNANRQAERNKFVQNKTGIR